MPTPSETTLPPSPPSDIASRASFTSCPPEDDRDHNAPREQRLEIDDSVGQSSAGADEEAADEHTITQAPTPEPDSEAGAPRRESSQETEEKAQHVEDSGMSADPPSPVASPEAQAEAHTRFTQSVQRSAESPVQEPLYLHASAPNPQRLLPSTTSSFLRPGSKFHGTQQSDRQVYDVQVEIKDVDMAESFLCGYLRIQGRQDANIHGSHNMIVR